MMYDLKIILGKVKGDFKLDLHFRSLLQELDPYNPDRAKKSWEKAFSGGEGPTDGYYLVHGVSAFPSLQSLFALQSADFDYDQASIDLLRNPHDIERRKFVSCSVISKDKDATFRNAGLILHAPFENVVFMSNRDAGSNFMNPYGQMAGGMGRGARTLQQLMQETEAGSYNEVALTGATDHGTIKVVGIFIKVDDEGTALDKETADVLRLTAHMHDLPIIELHDQRPEWQNTQPEVHTMTPHPYMISVNRSGWRYIIDFADYSGELKPIRIQKGDKHTRVHAVTLPEIKEIRRILADELPDAKVGIIDYPEITAKFRSNIPLILKGIDEIIRHAELANVPGNEA